MTAIDILIVDDQRDVRRMLKAALESLSPDIRVQDIPSAEEALYLLSRQSFRLLVADIRLAGMSGIELVEKVRQIQPQIKLILITGLTDQSILQSIEQAPIEAWFPKPVDINAFLQRTVQLVELGLPVIPSVSPEEPVHQTQLEPPVMPSSIGEEIASANPALETWREQLQLDCLLKLDRQGHLVEQAGEIPAGWNVKTLFQFFTEAESAIHTLQNRFGVQSIPPLTPYQAEQHLAGYIPAEEAIFIYIVKCKPEPHDFSSYHHFLIALTEQLSQRIHRPASLDFAPEDNELTQSALQETNLPPDPELELILAGKEKPTAVDTNVDEFWDRVETSIHLSEDINQKTLGFEEARRLGLTDAPHPPVG